jgi:predicted double-glycine peptidase
VNPYPASSLETAAARASLVESLPARPGGPTPNGSSPAFSQTLDQAKERAQALLASIPPVISADPAPSSGLASALSSIRGFDQTNPAEYDSPGQARTWGYSTCSSAALTAILRANGSPARISDVLRAMDGGITPQQGLVSRPALVAAAQRFGLQASDDVTSYQAIQQALAQGQPVMLDVTNKRFPEGHWLTVTGADANGVTVADSSRYNLTSIPRGELLATWSGRGIRVSGPAAAAAPATSGR